MSTVDVANNAGALGRAAPTPGHAAAGTLDGLAGIYARLLSEIGLQAQGRRLESLLSSAPRAFGVREILADLRRNGVRAVCYRIEHGGLAESEHPQLVIPDDAPASLVKNHAGRVEVLDAQTSTWTPAASGASLAGKDTTCIRLEQLPEQTPHPHWLRRRLESMRGVYSTVLATSLISSILALTVPLVTMAVYDRVIGSQDPGILPGVAVGGALAIGLMILMRVMRARVMSAAGRRLSREVGDETFSRLLEMPLATLSRVGISHHMSRIKGAERYRELLSSPIAGAVADAPFTIVALIAIAVIGGWLVLVPIAALVIYTVIGKALQRRSNNLAVDAGSAGTQYQQRVTEAARRSMDIRGSMAQDGWQKQFDRAALQQARATFRVVAHGGLVQAVAYALGILTALATLGTGILLVLDGVITPGALIASIMLIWRVTAPAQMAFTAGSRVMQLKNYGQQVDRFMTAERESSAGRLEVPDNSKAPTLVFERVTLRFSADREPALAGAEFTVEPGEICVVLGPNGAGKTSLLRTAAGIYPAQSGGVYLNGLNLQQYDPQIYRQWVGYASSEPEIFEGTLAENVALARSGATREEIELAVRQAGGDYLFDYFPDGLDTPAQAPGAHLVAPFEGSILNLARVYLKQPRLALLDDPLVEGSDESRKLFAEAIGRMRGRVTVLFSTHDAELAKLADKAIVLNRGSTVYAGPLLDESASQGNEQ